MKSLALIPLFGLLLSCSAGRDFKQNKTDLTTNWDTLRPLVNPDKGWYHHMLDNGVWKYLIQDEEGFRSFPGMDHLYLRLAWAFLEPEEGKYDWSYIDDIVDKYVPLGYKISFRISCKETGEAPKAVPVEINGIRYATPYWVVQAGAKGIERPEYGSASWTPVWDDPVFLEKLNNFHRAFAEKYDGKPWVRYVDVGSIGEWGEGHTFFSTRIPPSQEEIKTHMDLYMKHYKHSQLVVTDDLLAYDKSEEDMQVLLNYAIDNGFTLRDDSPLVAGYIQNELDTWTVRNPEFFDAAYKTMPTILEMEHYGKVKDNGYWLGSNGEEIIPEYGVSGAEIFRNAMELIHPTYIGFHGYLGDWLGDNPELTKELLNRCGYWYFPVSVNISRYKSGVFSFEIEWQNRGLAPAYSPYELHGKLIPADDAAETIEFKVEDSGNRNWFPDQTVVEKYGISLPVEPRGNYQLAIQLFDPELETPVEVGLKAHLKKDGYYVIQNISF